MDLTRHCELCDHQKISLKQGTTCGLTGRKPDFHGTCSKITLREKFEEKLKSVNVAYENIKRKKALTYSYFVVFLAIGLTVIVGGYLFGKYILGKGVISVGPLIIMAVGIAPLGMAFGALNKHRRELEVAKSKKEKVDEVLQKYRITYNLDIQFGKEIHGTQEVYVDLKVKGVPNN